MADTITFRPAPGTTIPAGKSQSAFVREAVRLYSAITTGKANEAAAVIADFFHDRGSPEWVPFYAQLVELFTAITSEVIGL